MQFRPQNGLSAPTQLGAPLACSSHVLTPHNASLDDPEAGLGLHQLEGRAQQYLHGNLKLDAVLDSCLIISLIIVAQRNVMGRNLSQTAKLRSKSYCTVAPTLYSWDRTFKQTVLAPSCTVQYGTDRLDGQRSRKTA